MRHPLYIVAYAGTYFLRGFKFDVHLYDEQEIVSMLRQGKSIIRFGDGEINLLLGLRNHYHAYTPRLARMIKEIIGTYGPQSPYLLSIPRFITVSNEELRATNAHTMWMPLKVMFLLRFPKKVSYMDAHNFYYDRYFERVVAPVLSGRKIVLITNADTIRFQLNNPRFPWNDALFVEIPEADVLNAYNRITDNLDCLLKEVSREEVTLLFAAGPAGKSLVKAYAERGYQSLDIGKVAEIMFTDESIEWMI